jgi:hypothetical protein
LAVPKPEIIWFKNGVKIENDERVQSHDAKGGVYQLSIKNSRKEDTGTYTCKAINEIGEVECSAQLVIEMTPQFLKKLEKLDAVESCEAEWYFQLIGVPKPKIEFSKNNNDVILDEKNYMLIEQEDYMYNLKFKSVKKLDVGNWTCTATNTAGTASCVAKLETLPLTHPKFTKEFSDCRLPENIDNKLEIHVTGIPFPSIEWFKDGILIDTKKTNKYKIERDMSTGAIFLVIYNCKTETDSGIYKVRAYNPGGECSCEGKILVKGNMFCNFFNQIYIIIIIK